MPRLLKLVNFTYPLDDDVEAMVLSAGEGVIFAGSESSSLRFQAPLTLDLEGRLVVPGLRDAHTHLFSTALSYSGVDLKSARSIEEVKEIVRRKAAELGPGEWVVGRGWDQEKLEEKRVPSREDLDEAAPRNPVILVRVCGHAAVINTKAAEALGLAGKAPEGLERFVVKEDGRLTGLLLEDAVAWALGKVPKPSLRVVKPLICRVLGEYLSYGVVSLHSMSAGPDELSIISTLEREGLLNVKYEAYVAHEQVGEIPPGAAHLVRGVKAFADGSFGARTAALREPYSDAESAGTLLMKAEQIAELARRAAARGLDTAVHAIGDLAVEQVLEGARLAKTELRIEHASLTPPDLLERISELKLRVSVQPHFILSDTWIVDRLGYRARWVYAYRSLLSTGATLMGSSDSPVEPLNPWLGIYAAVNRGGPEGLPIHSYTASERISFKEALSIYALEKTPREYLVVLNTTSEPCSREEYARVRAVKVFAKGVQLGEIGTLTELCREK
ncbi:MAG: amidohydrolase [Thermofilum sp.]